MTVLSGVSDRMEAAPGVLEALDRGLTHPNQASDWRAAMQSTEDDLFWSKVSVTGFCWDWTGYHDRAGYGQLKRDGIGYRAHRYAYELLIGIIEPGLVLDHLCRNHRCVNPDHLEPVTDRENVLRGYGITANRSRSDQCMRGHEFTAENTLWTAEGWRECRLCKRARNRASKAKAYKADKSPCVMCGKTFTNRWMAEHVKNKHSGERASKSD